MHTRGLQGRWQIAVWVVLSGCSLDATWSTAVRGPDDAAAESDRATQPGPDGASPADAEGVDAGTGGDVTLTLDGGDDAARDVATMHDSGVDVLGDAGSDLGSDSGRDASTDRGSDAGFDTGFDAGSDLGSDLGNDLGSDLGSDAGFDAGSDVPTDRGAADTGCVQNGCRGRVPRSCREILECYCGERPTSGEYEITPSGAPSGFSVRVYCDMQTEGGGWTRLLRVVPDRDGLCPDGTRRFSVRTADAQDGQVCARLPGQAMATVATTPVGPFQEYRASAEIWVYGNTEGFASSSMLRPPTVTAADNFADGVAVLFRDANSSSTEALYTWTVGLTERLGSAPLASWALNCPCEGGTAPPGFVGLRYGCRPGATRNQSLTPNAWRVAVQPWTDGAAGCTVAMNSTPALRGTFSGLRAGGLVVRLMVDEPAGDSQQLTANEDLGLHRFELWVR